MVTTIAYLAALGATFAYLVAYGGQTGLWGGTLQVGASLVSLVIAIAFSGSRLAPSLLASVDFALLGAMLWLALRSTRRWPIWVAGFQVNVVAAHVSIWIVPDWRGDLYYAMITVWAIPILLVMTIGTSLDRRHEFSPRAAVRHH